MDCTRASLGDFSLIPQLRNALFANHAGGVTRAIFRRPYWNPEMHFAFACGFFGLFDG
jgi:hypothetical protein